MNVIVERRPTPRTDRRRSAASVRGVLATGWSRGGVPAGATPSPPHLSADAVRLAAEHLGLVQDALHQVARRLPAHVDRDDLAGAGSVALVHAARLFDPARDVEFPAFAAKRVRGAMLDELRRWDWAARSVRPTARRRAGAVEGLQGRLNREPTAAEIATELGVSIDHLRRGMSDSTRATVASLQNLTAEDSGHMPVAATTPADVLVQREGGAYLRDAVDTLPDRERHAVVGHYLDGRPMRELARELGVSESRVSQLCKLGLTRLHDGLAPYVMDEDPPFTTDTGVVARRRQEYRSAVAARSTWKARLDSRPPYAGRADTHPEPRIA